LFFLDRLIPPLERQAMLTILNFSLDIFLWLNFPRRGSVLCSPRRACGPSTFEWCNQKNQIDGERHDFAFFRIATHRIDILPVHCDGAIHA
jgi:hypothetical protein